MTEHESKVAVITGASSGIGLATALEFAAKGYNVVLAARRINELQKVAKQCEEHGVRALPVKADTTDDKAVHQLATESHETFGRIDVWVNNAAVYLTGKFEETPLEDMRQIMETNFFGYIHGTHAALEIFRSQGFGTLINVSSVNAAAPQPYVSIYSASKAAVRAFSTSLRMELQLEGLSDRIHICTVMPASIDTNLFQNGANYTGKDIRALEPVYEPSYVAEHIVKLAGQPKREVIVGPAGKMMALQNMIAPALYEKQIAKYTDANLLGKVNTAQTPGNLYLPLAQNTGTHGGWRGKRIRADHLNVVMGVGITTIAGLATLGYLAIRRAQR